MKHAILSVSCESCNTVWTLYTCYTGMVERFGKYILEQTASFGPRREKTCLRGVANNTGADQPAHPRSLISAFVIHFLESINI